MAFHCPAVGLNPFWNPHYVQLLGSDSFRSECIAAIPGVSTRTRISSEGAAWASEALCDLVSRDVVKAVEDPKLPLQAGCPILKDRFSIVQMGTQFASTSYARAWWVNKKAKDTEQDLRETWHFILNRPAHFTWKRSAPDVGGQILGNSQIVFLESFCNQKIFYVTLFFKSEHWCYFIFMCQRAPLYWHTLRRFLIFDKFERG